MIFWFYYIGHFFYDAAITGFPERWAFILLVICSAVIGCPSKQRIETNLSGIIPPSAISKVGLRRDNAQQQNH